MYGQCVLFLSDFIAELIDLWVLNLSKGYLLSNIDDSMS